MTEMERIWEIQTSRAELDLPQTREMAEALGIRPVTAALLRARGCPDIEAARAFLSKDGFRLHNPMLLPDMEAAVKRLRAAIDGGERVVVYGDYDVDGVTAVSVLTLYLRSRGVDTGFYIPSRATEGFGVNTEAIRTIADGGAKLIVTVDTGITANGETEEAAALGIDMIITDHHSCLDTLPRAVAVVNPRREDSRYPFPSLAGVGVVFKLVCAVEATYPHGEGEDWLRELCEKYMELVALGTIADVMPLINENRLIASIGLRLIANTHNTGIAALLASSDVNGDKRRQVTSSLIGYTLAPRINAAGRLGHASRAAELFLTDDPSRAAELARELCEVNRERQTMESVTAEEAFKMLADTDLEHTSVIVLATDHWHGGVIGIVASRITERNGLPSIMISFEGGGDIGKGSGRSVKGLNLAEALAACSDHLVRFGGHEMAAGLSVTREELPAFREAINAYAAPRLKELGERFAISVDMELTDDEISLSQAEELRMLEPFGSGNPTPVFALYGGTAAEVAPIGGGKHTRMLINAGKRSFAAVRFGASPAELGISAGAVRDFVFQMEVNEFRGSRSVQLIIRDIAVPSAEQNIIERVENLYKLVNIQPSKGSPEDTEELPEFKEIVPCREDFAAVFLALRRTADSEDRGYVTDTDLLRVLPAGDAVCVRVKARVALDIFNEMNLIELCEAPGGWNYRIRAGERANLERSAILRRVRRRLTQRNAPAET